MSELKRFRIMTNEKRAQIEKLINNQETCQHIIQVDFKRGESMREITVGNLVTDW